MKLSISNTAMSITCTMLSLKAVVLIVIVWRNRMSNYHTTAKKHNSRSLCRQMIYVLIRHISPHWLVQLDKAFACLYSLSHFGQVAQDNQTIGCSFDSCQSGW